MIKQLPPQIWAINKINVLVLRDTEVSFYLKDEWGEPVADAAYQIRLFNGDLHDGVTDYEGYAELKDDYVESIEGAKVQFPEISPLMLRPSALAAEDLQLEAGYTYEPQSDDDKQWIPLLPETILTFECNTRTKVYLSLFFDGTGNSLEADQAAGKLSNVACLHEAYDEDTRFRNYYRHYINGVGTQLSSSECGNPMDWWDCFRDSAKIGGSLATGARYRLEMMMELIEGTLNDFPDVKEISISLFGFSRGAALARIFCHCILEGIKQKDTDKLYSNVTIQFLGIFDTVTSMGIGGNNIDLGYDVDIPDEVKQVVHYIAAHERRRHFDLQSIRTNGQTPVSGNRIEKMYPGMHSDVGGGYLPVDQGRQSRLATMPLLDMHKAAFKYGVPLITLKEAEANSETRNYYSTTSKLLDAYTAYKALISPSKNLYKELAQHERLYFWWLATTKGNIPTHYDEGSKNSLDDLWESELYWLEKGHVSPRKRGRPARKRPPIIESEVKEYMEWINEALVQPGIWKHESTKPVKILFDDYIHDSVAGFLDSLVDGYLQKRAIFFHNDSRWINEDRK